MSSLGRKAPNSQLPYHGPRWVTSTIADMGRGRAVCLRRLPLFVMQSISLTAGTRETVGAFSPKGGHLALSKLPCNLFRPPLVLPHLGCAATALSRGMAMTVSAVFVVPDGAALVGLTNRQTAGTDSPPSPTPETDGGRCRGCCACYACVWRRASSTGANRVPRPYPLLR